MAGPEGAVCPRDAGTDRRRHVLFLTRKSLDLLTEPAPEVERRYRCLIDRYGEDRLVLLDRLLDRLIDLKP